VAPVLGRVDILDGVAGQEERSRTLGEDAGLRNAQASNLERIATDEGRDAQEQLKGADEKEAFLAKSGEGQSCPHPVVPECQRSN